MANNRNDSNARRRVFQLLQTQKNLSDHHTNIPQYTLSSLQSNTDFIDALTSRNESRVIEIMAKYPRSSIAEYKDLLCLIANNNLPNALIAAANQGAECDQRTPLHCAAEKGFFDIAKIAIDEYTYIINNTDNEGATACFLAVKNGHVDIVKMLIEKGADFDIVGLLKLAKTKQLENPEIYDKIIEYLESRASIKNYCCQLLAALKKEDETDILAILEQPSPAGWDINMLIDKGTTILNLATQRGFLNTVKKLVAKGALIDDGLHKTALHFAVEKNHIQIAKFLIEKNPHTINRSTKTAKISPFVRALEYGSCKMFELFVDSSADLDSEMYAPFIPNTRMTLVEIINHRQIEMKQKGRNTPKLDKMQKYLLKKITEKKAITSHEAIPQTSLSSPIPFGFFSRRQTNSSDAKKRTREPDIETPNQNNDYSSAKKQKTHLPAVIKIEDHEENPIRTLQMDQLWQVIKTLRGNNNCKINCIYLIIDLINYFKTSKLPSEPSRQEYVEGFLDCTTTRTQTRIKPENGYLSTTVPHHRTYWANTGAQYASTSLMPLPTPFTAKITIEEDHAPKTQKIYLLDQEMIFGSVYTLDEIDDRLKKEAQNNNGTSFGMIHQFTKSGKGTNHLLFYFSDEQEVTYIDIHRFNGETQTGNPIFDINGLKTNYLYYLSQIKTTREVTPETYDYRLAYLSFAPHFSSKKSYCNTSIKEEQVTHSDKNYYSYHF